MIAHNKLDNIYDTILMVSVKFIDYIYDSIYYDNSSSVLLCVIIVNHGGGNSHWEGGGRPSSIILNGSVGAMVDVIGLVAQ